MKKFLVVLAALVLVVAAMFSTSCSSSPTAAATSTPTTVPTVPVPTAVPTVEFAFASGLDGWGVPNQNWSDEWAFAGPVNDAADGHLAANGCLAVTATFNNTQNGLDMTGSGGNDYSSTKVYIKGNIVYTLPAPLTMTASTISVWVKVPTAMAAATSGAYKAQLFVANPGTDTLHAWGYANSPTPVLMNTAGWVLVSGAVNTFSGGISLTNITSIGCQIYLDTAVASLPADALTGETVKFDDISYTY